MPFSPFFCWPRNNQRQAESRAAALEAKAASLGDDLRAKTAELEDALAAAERGGAGLGLACHERKITKRPRVIEVTHTL